MIQENIAGLSGKRLIILAIIAMSIVCIIASGVNGPNELQNASLDFGKNISQEENKTSEEGTSATTMPVTEQGPDIRVTKEYTDYMSNGAQYIIYKIEVINDGGTGLENVALIDSLPDGLIFLDARLSFDKKGNTEEIGLIKPMIDYTKTYANLTWILGDLGINEIATINMKVKKLISTIQPTANKAYAWGKWINVTANRAEKVSDGTVKVEKMRQEGPSPT